MKYMGEVSEIADIAPLVKDVTVYYLGLLFRASVVLGHAFRDTCSSSLFFTEREGKEEGVLRADSRAARGSDDASPTPLEHSVVELDSSWHGPARVSRAHSWMPGSGGSHAD